MTIPKVTQWTPPTQAHTYLQVEDLTTPLIYTDPKIAENLTQSDNGDSETEGPQVDFIGEYCGMCITKWFRCMCKPGSDWDEDPINIITDGQPI